MLGVHFAITADQEKALVTADEDEVSEFVGDLEEAWDEEELKVDTDRAWDAIHRCLDPEDGEYPLSHAVLGGRDLHSDYYVILVTAAEVRDVAAALRPLTSAWLRERYDAIDPDDYDGPHGDEDFDYTWGNFEDMRAFYDRAATAGRAVLFTAT